MPRSIVSRANEILGQLEEKAIDEDGPTITTSAKEQSDMQLSIFETVDPTAGKIKEMLQEVEINQMTPIDCMLALLEMKKALDEND